jgi:Na+-transporting methylmalonyl-CoA/oxaloacetate decarboxylase gamma subunit
VIFFLVLVIVLAGLAGALIVWEFWPPAARMPEEEPSVEENARPLGNVEVLDHHRRRA